MKRHSLRLAVLGDSLAYGTGAARPEDTLGARLAGMLNRSGYAVELHVLGVPGATSFTSPPRSGAQHDSTPTSPWSSSARTTCPA